MVDPQTAKINFKTIHFNGLSLTELHDLLKLRTDIFVVEQDCPYPEIDGKDPECLHTLGVAEDGQIAAAARIVPAGVIYSDVSIGRVVVQKDFRGQKLGRLVMKEALDYCKHELRADQVKIAAQQYLEDFYTSLGFETVSGIYQWDGIDHVDMVRKMP